MPDYEYTGLMAQAWDLLRGDYSTWPDRPFYRAIIEQNDGPALDVGCGTGRLTLDYLQAGLDIDGVDNSPEMLDICRDKAAALNIDVTNRLFQQQMDVLDLPRKYATILVPSSSFQLLTDKAAAAEALRRFHAHLQTSGVLVMSIMSQLWPGDRTPPHMKWTDWMKAGQKPRPEDSALIRRQTRVRYDLDNQLEHEENRYELVVEGEVVQTEEHSRIPAVRWYTQQQTIATVEAAGFTDVHLTSGFTEAPATETDTTFCVIGVRG
jgi:SAM-dependent methyltransferase